MGKLKRSDDAERTSVEMATRPRPAGVRSRIWAAALASALILGLLAAPGASAVTGHQFEASFGEAGHDSAQFELTPFSSVAVNETAQDVYVTDTGNHRVDEFSAAGAFLRAFGADVGGPGVDVCTVGCLQGTAGTAPGAFESPSFIAVDNSAAGTGSVYVVDSGDGVVSKFAADGTIVSAWGIGGQLPSPGTVGGVAVDPAGNLDVLDGANQIHRFEPDGTQVAGFEVARGSFMLGLGVDSGGNFFKSNGEPGSIQKLEPDGESIGQVTEPATGSSSNTTGFTANPRGDSFYFDTGTSVEEYDFVGPAEVLQPSAPCAITRIQGCNSTISFGSGSLTAAAGLAVDVGSGQAFVADPGAHRVAVFSSVTLPDVTTEAATAVGPAGATLHGTINAAGGAEARCKFEITTAESFKNEGFTGAIEVPCAPAGPFTGNTGEAVLGEVSSLNAGTSYRFRLVGTNDLGSYPEQSSSSGAVSLRTEGPVILSSEVSRITARGAMINTVIEPQGAEATSFHVEYGPTTDYGSFAPIPDAAAVLPVGSGTVEPKPGDPEEDLTQINDLAVSQGAFTVGQEITGLGIEPETTIIGIESRLVGSQKGERLFLTLSKPAEFGFFETNFTSPTTSVSQRLVGLAPSTLYHFRVVATGAGVDRGPNASFSTLAEGAGSSGRAYELVSPAEKIGEPIPPESGGAFGSSCGDVCTPGEGNMLMPIQASPDGEGLAYDGQPFSASLSPGANQYIAGRSISGWSSQAVSPSQLGPTVPGKNNGFKAFSPDLSRGVLLQTTPAPALSSGVPSSGGAAYSDLYLWEKGASGLRPLVTAEPPNRTPGPPEEGEFNFSNNFQLSFGGGNSGAGGVAGFSHLVFEANDSLTPAVPGVAPAAPEVPAGPCGGFPSLNFPESNCNIYDWADGHTSLVNVLPGNESAATRAVIGGGRQLTGTLASEGTVSSQAPDTDNAISADGSRIFWSDENGQVYVRIDGRETVKIKDPGGFLSASDDGSRLLLRDGCLYSLGSESCEAMLGEQEAGSTFLGTLGASEDLSVVYFVDSGALTPGSHPESCEEPLSSGSEEEAKGKDPVGTSCNLYVYDHGDVRYIGLLRWRDNNFVEAGVYGAWKASPSNRVARVTPDGRFLAFTSVARLTDYDNRQRSGKECPEGATTGTSCREVYEYDLASHALKCASCNPSGQRPLGLSTLNLINPEPGIPFQQPEALPADGEGRLFFESNDALLPADTNGHVADVYEWSPEGVGGCEQPRGCLALISSGHSAVDSQFLTASRDASDVFFITRERLVPQDQDDLADIYDARVGVGFEADASPACEGEGCKSQSTPTPTPVQPSAASSAFSGPGNQKAACKKGYVKKQGKCVKAKQKKKHHKTKHHKTKHHKTTTKSSRSNQRTTRSDRGGSK
jgi:hypothetical protein